MIHYFKTALRKLNSQPAAIISVDEFDKNSGIVLFLIILFIDLFWTLSLLDLMPVRISGEIFQLKIAENIRETGLPHYTFFDDIDDYYFRSLLFTYPLAFIIDLFGETLLAIRILPVLFYLCVGFLVFYVVGGLFGVAAAITVFISSYQFYEIIAKPYTASEFQYLLIAVLFYKAFVEGGAKSKHIWRRMLPLAIAWGALTYEGAGLAVLLIAGLGIIYLSWEFFRQKLLWASMVLSIAWLYFSSTISFQFIPTVNRVHISISRLFDVVLDMVWTGKHVGAALNTLGTTFLKGVSVELLVFLLGVTGLLFYRANKRPNLSILHYLHNAPWPVLLFGLACSFILIFEASGSISNLFEGTKLTDIPLGAFILLCTIAVISIVMYRQDRLSRIQIKLLYWIVVLFGSLLMCAAFEMLHQDNKSASTRLILHLFPISIIVVWLSAAYIARELFAEALPSRATAYAVWIMGIAGISILVSGGAQKPAVLRGYTDYPKILEKWSTNVKPDDLVVLIDDYSIFTSTKKNITADQVLIFMESKQPDSVQPEEAKQDLVYNYRKTKSSQYVFSVIENAIKKDQRVWMLSTAAADPIPKYLYDRYAFRFAHEFYDLKQLPADKFLRARDQSTKTVIETKIELVANGPRMAEAVSWGWDDQEIGRKLVRLKPGVNTARIFSFPAPAKHEISLLNAGVGDSISVDESRYSFFGEARYPILASTGIGRAVLEVIEPVFTGVETFYPLPPSKPWYGLNNPKIIPLIYQVDQ